MKVVNSGAPLDIIVCGGLGGNSWASYRVKPNGSIERVKSPKLPVRATEAKALADLKEYASQKSLFCPSREATYWRSIWLAAWRKLDPQEVASYLKGQEEFHRICEGVESGVAVVLE